MTSLSVCRNVWIGALACAGLVVCAVGAEAASRWIPVGPEGGNVVALVFDAAGHPAVYAAVEEGGVWRSTDGVASWVSASGNLPPGTARALAVDSATPGTVFLGRSTDGVWKTADGGGSWTQVAAELGGAPAEVRVLGFEPVSRSLWAGLVPKAGQPSLFRSDDGGGHWTAIGFGAAGKEVTALAFGGGDAYVGTAGSGIFRAPVAGGPWTALFPGENVHALAFAAGALYATADSGLSASPDRGATWQLRIAPPADPGPPPNRLFLGALAVHPIDPRRVYVAYALDRFFDSQQAGIYSSLDGGVTHDTVRGFPSALSPALLFEPSLGDRLLAAPGALGVWDSGDGTTGWRSRNRGLRAAPVSRVLADPKRAAILYAGGTGDGLQRSVDGGATWSLINGGGTIGNVEALDPEQPATLYARAFGAARRFVSKSVNGGRSWSRILPEAISFALDPRHPKTLYAGFRQGLGNPVYRSDDGGATWRFGGIDCTVASKLVVAPTGQVYAGGYSLCGVSGFIKGGVDRSDDGGQTFQNKRQGLPDLPIPYSLAVDPRRPATLFGGFQGVSVQPQIHTIYGLFRSRDRAEHWEEVPTLSGLGVPVVDVLFPPAGASAVWLASRGRGVWRSGDAGETFRPVAIPGLPTDMISDLEFDRRSPASLYAGTPGGLFRLASD